MLDTDPLIWREVEVPTSITLKVLHDVIQISRGWLDDHLWEFTVGERSCGPPMDEDRDTATGVAASMASLQGVLRPEKTVIDSLYDFGEFWEYRLTVTAIRPGEPGVSYPRRVGGARAKSA